MACDEVPMAWRNAAALCTYLYLRPGELDALPWDDVDLEHVIVHVHRATCGRTGRLKEVKTGEARRVPSEAELAPLLARGEEPSGGERRRTVPGSAAEPLRFWPGFGYSAEDGPREAESPRPFSGEGGIRKRQKR